MMHECCAETLPLVLVDHSESDLGLSGLHDDVTCAARDHAPAAFVNDCDQRYVIHEIDVQEKPDFRLGEVPNRCDRWQGLRWRQRIMWRPEICGARATSVSVEYGSELLTPHILVWMIAVHHHGWRTDHARRTIRAAGRCRSLSRRALRGISRAIPAAGARGRLLAGDARKYGLGVACCGGGNSPRRRERIVRVAEEYTSPAHAAQIHGPSAVRKHGQALSSLRESMAAQHRRIDP